MGTQEIRERTCEAVAHLYEVDDKLAELAKSLALPDSRIPSLTTNLYAALDAVRTDCLQDAALSLLHAVGQSESSWRREWARWTPLHLMKPSRIQRSPDVARGAENAGCRTSEVQREVRELCVDLERIDQRLEHLCERLPEPSREFVAQAEIRGLLACVRTDLLADAIATLESASRDDAGLHLLFARRQHLSWGPSDA